MFAERLTLEFVVVVVGQLSGGRCLVDEAKLVVVLLREVETSNLSTISALQAHKLVDR